MKLFAQHALKRPSAKIDLCISYRQFKRNIEELAILLLIKSLFVFLCENTHIIYISHFTGKVRGPLNTQPPYRVGLELSKRKLGRALNRLGMAS